MLVMPSLYPGGRTAVYIVVSMIQMFMAQRGELAERKPQAAVVAGRVYVPRLSQPTWIGCWLVDDALEYPQTWTVSCREQGAPAMDCSAPRRSLPSASRRRLSSPAWLTERARSLSLKRSGRSNIRSSTSAVSCSGCCAWAGSVAFTSVYKGSE